MLKLTRFRIIKKFRVLTIVEVEGLPRTFGRRIQEVQTTGVQRFVLRILKDRQGFSETYLIEKEFKSSRKKTTKLNFLGFSIC